MEQTVKNDENLSLDDSLEVAWITNQEEDQEQKETEQSQSHEQGETQDVKQEEAPEKAPIAATLQTTSTPPPVSFQPPPHWNKQEIEEFKKLPPNIQEIITRKAKDAQAVLDRHVTKLNQQHAQYEQTYKDLNQVFTPERQQTLRAAGLSLPTMVERAFQWQETLQKNPVAGIYALAKSYNISIEDLIDFEESGKARQMSENTVITELQNKIKNLESAHEQSASEREIAEIRQRINMFANEVDENGYLKRPYFEELKPLIRQILPAVYEENPEISEYDALHEAWERAIFAHPTYRQEIFKAAEAAQKEQLGKAKQASTSLIGEKESPPTSGPKKARSIDEALEMALEEHNII